MTRSFRGWKLPIVAAVVAVAATACSSSSSSSGGGTTTPDATIFVQNFRYNGVPATLPSGIVTLLFQNQESFPITHEMIPIALPTGHGEGDEGVAA